MSKGPVLVYSLGALQTYRFVTEEHGVEHDENLGVVRRANSHSFISGEVDHAGIELVWLRSDIKPVFIQLAEVLDALMQLILIKSRHVKPLTR